MLRILQLLETLDSAPTPSALSEAWQTLIENMGFAAFEYVELSADPLAKSGLGTSGSWRETYANYHFERVDPILAHAWFTEKPFDWSSLPIERMQAPSVRMLMDAAADFGLKQGLVLPQHYRDDHGRLRSHICALFWTDDPAAFHASLAQHRHVLHLASLHFFERVRSFDDAGGAQPRRPALTYRECEFLLHAARGRTNREIASLLNVTEQTAETHMKNIARKLGALNRTHAVSLALARGLIHI